LEEILFEAGVGAFWVGVIAFDVYVLVLLRRLRLPEVATVIWVIWIIVAPVIGAGSFLIVRGQRKQFARGFDVVPSSRPRSAV